jgi:hypothetical protein
MEVRLQELLFLMMLLNISAEEKFLFKEYMYYFAASRYQVPEYWLVKGNGKPVLYDFQGSNKIKMMNLLKDKPEVYKKWNYSKNRDLAKYIKKNTYQMIDDYNSAP